MIGQTEVHLTRLKARRSTTKYVNDALISLGIIVVLIGVPAVISTVIVNAAEFIEAHVEAPNLIVIPK